MYISSTPGWDENVGESWLFAWENLLHVAILPLALRVIPGEQHSAIVNNKRHQNEAVSLSVPFCSVSSRCSVCEQQWVHNILRSKPLFCPSELYRNRQVKWSQVARTGASTECEGMRKQANFNRKRVNLMDLKLPCRVCLERIGFWLTVERSSDQIDKEPTNVSHRIVTAMKNFVPLFSSS